MIFNYRLLLLGVIGIAMLALSPAGAQEQGVGPRLTLGIGAGYEYSGSFRAAVNDTCLCNPDRRERMHQAQGFIELAAPQLFGDLFGITARVEWIASNASITHSWPGILVLVPEHPVNHHDERRITFSMRQTGVDLLGSLRLPWGFSLGLGPTAGYRSISDYRDTLQIDSLTKSYSPYPGWTKEYTGENTVVERSHLSLGALLVASCRISLTDRFSLVPELRLRADFTPPIRNDEWGSFSYGGGLAIAYHL
jgi:hypothetical protein